MFWSEILYRTRWKVYEATAKESLAFVLLVAGVIAFVVSLAGGL